MAIRKTLSTLCLLATTALAGTPTYTYHNTISGGGLTYPNGLAFDNANNLYVTSWGNSRILVFNATAGAVVNNTLANPQGPRGGLSVFGNNLYTIQLEFNIDLLNPEINFPTYEVFTCTTSGGSPNTFLPISTGEEYTGLTISGSTLYVATSSTVFSYDLANNTTLTAPLISGLDEPEGLAVHGGKVYVANFGNNTVTAFDENTNTNTTLISGLNRPQSVTVDPQGQYLYVTNNTSGPVDGTIEVYKNDGTHVTTISEANSNTFRNPQCTAISPDGRYLYVADSNNNLIQVFSITYPSTLSPALLTLVGQGTMDQEMFNALSSLPMTVNLTLPQATQLMHSVGNMSAAMSQISTAVGGGMGFVSSVAGAVVSTGLNAPSSTQDSHSSFTSRQRSAFKNLTQQLPMFQFQSLQSLVDPVAGPVSYAAAATPFEQPKMTLKPVFLNNDNHHIWIQPYGGLQRLDSYDQVTGYSLKTIGTAMGAGGKVTQNVILGVLVGGAMNSYTQDHTSGDGSVDNYYAGLYGGYAMPGSGFHVDGSVILGQSKYTGDRNLSALGLVAKNSHKGWDASGQIQTGYKISYGNLSVDPFVAVGARYSYQNAYQETNANPFNLSISSATTKTATIEMGSKFQQSMVVNETMVSPMISLSAYREQPLAKQSNARMNFTDGGNSFSVPVSNQIKTFAKVTVGCAAMFTNDISISALVTGKIKKHEKSVEALVKVSYAF